jgi:hypothetical protein
MKIIFWTLFIVMVIFMYNSKDVVLTCIIPLMFMLPLLGTGIAAFSKEEQTIKQ